MTVQALGAPAVARLAVRGARLGLLRVPGRGSECRFHRAAQRARSPGSLCLRPGRRSYFVNVLNAANVRFRPSRTFTFASKPMRARAAETSASESRTSPGRSGLYSAFIG